MDRHKLKDLKKCYGALNKGLARPNEVVGPLADYLHESDSYFSDYQSVSNLDELVEKCVNSDLVYISDYHTFRYAQETSVELLNRFVEQGKRFMLCLEMVLLKYQRFIDAFLKKEISEKRFLKEIDYRKHWHYEWKNFKPFFDFARKNKIPVKGIGTYRIYDPKKTMELMAKRISSCDGPVVVVAGESHLCPSHLPASVKKLIKEKGKVQKHTIVLQDNENVYWKLAMRNLEERVNVTRLRKDVFNITNSTPIMRLREDAVLGREFVISQQGNAYNEEYGFYAGLCMLRDEAITSFVREMRFPWIKKAEYPRVFGSLSDLKAAKISKEEAKMFETRTKTCYMPKGNILYIMGANNALLEETAHECVHFVHFHFNKDLNSKVGGVDAFYKDCIMEAVAYFGTRALLPDRTFVALPIEFGQAHSFFARHIWFEQNYKKYDKSMADRISPLKKILQRPEIIVNQVTHLLGYRLGMKLYDAYWEGNISRNEIKELMMNGFRKRGSAMDAYFTLAERLE